MIRGRGADNSQAIPIRLVGPINVNHVVMHEPYPRPTQITITFFDNEGRSWVMPPFMCRGGAFRMENVPHRYEGQEWVRFQIDIRYGD